MSTHLVMMKCCHRISRSMIDSNMQGHASLFISHDTPAVQNTNRQNQSLMSLVICPAEKKRARGSVINPPTVLTVRDATLEKVIQYSMTAIPYTGLPRLPVSHCRTDVGPAKYNHLRNCVQLSTEEGKKNVGGRNEKITKNCLSRFPDSLIQSTLNSADYLCLSLIRF